MSIALVLGGGGVTGVGWELGVLLALSEAGVGVADADLVVGTSAGSVVGAQLTSGTGLQVLFDRQLLPPTEPSVEFDLERMGAVWVQLAKAARDPRDFRARLGARALALETVPESERIEVIGARLPARGWPDRQLQITAVDTGSGEFVVFDRHAGVPLTLAVAASCAVPLVWPPISIDGRRYMDGGMRSVTNAHLAAGHQAVLVLAPIASPGLGPMMPSLDGELEALRAAGGRVVVITPDDAALEAIGPNLLDPAMRAGSARAGLAQGKAAAEEVMALWTAGSRPPRLA